MTPLRMIRVRIGIGVLALVAACSPASLVDVSPPSSVVDPSVVTTASGAGQLYNFAVTRFSQILGGLDANGAATPGSNRFIVATGVFTDELLRVFGVGGFLTAGYDERNNSAVAGNNDYFGDYRQWNQPRTMARQARDALRLYAPATPAAWQGQLYALEAYTVLWFAEVYCSGIPLTTISLAGSPVLTPGFTTDELLTRAVAMFDSALTLASDSARFVNLAKVGKGRALLGLGRFADAAAAVHDVPTDFVYGAEYSAAASKNQIGNEPRTVQVLDGEGGNGLLWSADPRTAITTRPPLLGSGAQRVSAKYSRTSAGVLDASQAVVDNPIRVADGLEARLIEAEADVSAGGSNWLTILNTLRATCVGTAVCAPIPGMAPAALPPLADPGTAGARLDLVMKERAMWLYLTGHRQGDLRRLAHVYHRDVATLWPTGIYFNPNLGGVSGTTTGFPYGSDVVFNPNGTKGVVNSEASLNPLYTGCVNLDP